jgi:hypothetical protein
MSVKAPFTDDPLNTFGGAGVVEIPPMQHLLRYICENGRLPDTRDFARDGVEEQ